MAFHGFAIDRVRFTTATTGTGAVTVGTAVPGFRTPATAGIPDGKPLSLFILDGTDWEDSTGVYTASGTTLSRTLRESSTGSLLNLSGNAVVIVSPGKADFDWLLKYDTITGNAFLAGAGNFTASGGNSNVAVGQSSMAALTTGTNNVGFGFNIMPALTTGGYNVAVGANALAACTTASGNAGIGAGALGSATGGSNASIGFYSGAAITTGANNTVLGGSQDALNGPTSGSYNILIGYDADLPSPTGNYQLCIGNLIMGTGLSGTGTSYPGAIGIGTPAPDRRFHIEEETAVTNAINYLSRVTALSSGTPAVNIGVGLEFEIETSAGNNEVVVPVEARAVAVGAGAEAIIIDGRQMAAGAQQEPYGISPIIKTLASNAAYTSGTSAQPWFPSGGAVSLEATTTYEFEGHLLVATTAATTTHTMGLSFGGTATLTSIAYRADAHHAAANTTQPTSTAALSNATAVEQASNTVVTGLSGTTSGLRTSIWVRGIIRVNGAGTVIPQFQFSAARGAGNVLANTFFKLRKVGSNTVVNQGQWA